MVHRCLKFIIEHSLTPSDQAETASSVQHLSRLGDPRVVTHVARKRVHARQLRARRGGRRLAAARAARAVISYATPS